MEKIAYLILAHKNSNIFMRLIEKLLSDERSYIYVHVDASVEKADFLVDNCRVKYVERLHITWGGASIVHATVNLLSASVHDECTRFVLLSGDSYPLWDMKLINDFILFDIKNNLFELYDDNLGERGFNRVKRYWIFGGGSNKFAWFINKVWIKIQKIIKFERKYPHTINKVYVGSQWWIMTYEAAKLSLNIIDEKFLKYINHSRIPDEFVFHNIVYHFLTAQVENRSCMYYRFSTSLPYKGVEELSSEDCSLVATERKIFCRKASMNFIDRWESEFNVSS